MFQKPVWDKPPCPQSSLVYEEPSSHRICIGKFYGLFFCLFVTCEHLHSPASLPCLSRSTSWAYCSSVSTLWQFSSAVEIIYAGPQNNLLKRRYVSKTSITMKFVLQYKKTGRRREGGMSILHICNFCSINKTFGIIFHMKKPAAVQQIWYICATFNWFGTHHLW